MFIAAALFSTARFMISAFEFTIELIPFQRGDTVVFIPPVGELRAATHWLPFLLKITLSNVDLEMLAAGLEKLADAENMLFFEEQLRSKVGFYVLRSAVITFLCGAGTVMLLTRPIRWKRIVLGGCFAALFFLLILYGTVIAPYNIEAFDHPQYTGAIGAAPWVVNLSEQTLSAIKTMGEQLEVITANLQDLSRQLEQVQLAEPADGLRVLHVSDIHNNPAAIDFIEKVIGSFQIDLIIDTGDLTDYGTALETELLSRVAALPVPYLFVPGNHDSPQVIEAMRREGAVVLEHDLVEIKGLRISGIADPSSDGPSMTTAPDQTLSRISRAAYLLMAEEAWPDIVAVHHPLMGEPFLGRVPVILSGHTHRAAVNFEKQSALINAGSTGAAGVRGLSAPRENPYSMVVLYFSSGADERQTLVMADLLSVQQYQDSFTLQRYYKR
ncbi:MAG: metallophosphoesterase [Bacillota bacterium]